jgi:hypothetical protein
VVEGLIIVAVIASATWVVATASVSTALGVFTLGLWLRRIHAVLRSFLYGATGDERLLALTVRVVLNLWLEQHVQTLDMLAAAKV